MFLRLADTTPASGADALADAADDTIGFYDNPVYAYAWSVIVSRTSRRLGPVAVTGEPGLGKSLLLRRVMKGVGAGVHAVYLPPEGWELEGVLDRIEEVLGRPETGFKAGGELELRLAHCRERLGKERSDKVWVTLFVDDADHLPDAVLAELLRLALPDPEGEPILGLVLAGLPQLERRLAKPELQVLVADNLHVCHLRPLRASEVGVYIQKRCKVAGSWRNQLLSPQAAARIGAYSRGIPQLINMLCDAATETAERHHQERITEEIVEEAVQASSASLTLQKDGNASVVPVHGTMHSKVPGGPAPETGMDAGSDRYTDDGLSKSRMGPTEARAAPSVSTSSDDAVRAIASSGRGEEGQAVVPPVSSSVASSSGRGTITNRTSEGERPVDRTQSLNKVLKNLQSGSPDVEASALITEDGLMVASALPQDLDDTRVAGMSATLLSLGTRAAAELRRGEVQEVIVRGDEGYAVMITAGRGVLLLVVANEHAKLGLIFFDMREAINAIKRIL